jgi:pimeloyl-ACP methyl ester carboxylesterase
MDTPDDRADSTGGRLMMRTPPQNVENEVAGQERLRWPWIVGGVIVLFVVVFHIAGGFYFAGLIRSDGFQPRGPQAFIDATAGPIDDDTITLISAGDATDPTLEGLYGLKWDDGYGQISEISSVSDTGVVRTFTLLEGTQPAPGTEMDVMGWAWPSDPDRSFGYDYETIQFISELGPMDAWLLPGSTDRWAIFVHGKGVDQREGLRMLPSLHDAEMPTMLITYRNDIGQPEDPSGLYRYGQTEWRDLEDAIKYARGHGANSFVLVGMSTGAAIVTSFLYESDLAPLVDGVIFDSPNIDFGQVVDVEASRRSLPIIGLPIPATLTWVAKSIAALQMHFSWNNLDYIDQADGLAVPLLVFHGTEDNSVPIELSRRLADARPDLVRLVETDAGHVLSWNINPIAYERHIAVFLASV